MAWLADDLLTEIRRSGMLPSATVSATADADLLATADKQIATYFTPKVLDVHEEWFTTTSYVTTVQSQGRYRLPTRAINGRVRDIQLVRGGAWQILPRIEPSDAKNWSAPGSTGVSNAFYMESNYVVLVPTPASGGDTLRIRYYARPGRLCLSTASTTCGVISNITGTTTYSIAHSGGTIAGSYVDIVHSDPPFDYASLSLQVQGSNPGVVTVTASKWAYEGATQEILDAILTACYVTTSDLSPVVSLPESLWYALASRTAGSYLLGAGYLQEGQAQLEESDRLTEAALRSLQPRTDSRPKKISRWLSGPLGRRLSGYPWWTR